MAKSLFNFYLDDEKKQEVSDKLKRLCGDESKGQLAAFLRVCINMILITPDEKVRKEWIEAINEEYEYSQKKNKRSRM